MNVTKILFGAAAVLTAGTLAAQTTVLNKLTDWNKNTKCSVSGNTFTVKSDKGSSLITSKMYPIDPAKTYTLSFQAKADGLKDAKKGSTVYGGFIVYDKAGKEIQSWTVTALPNSFTTIAADAKKGSNFVLVKDLSKVRAVYYWYRLVAGAKADCSDMPNSNTIGNLKSVAKEGNNYKVTFTAPIAKDIKAGTPVRIQMGGGYMYSAGSSDVGSNWKLFNGVVKGQSPKGTSNSKQWWPTGAQFKIVILTNYNNNAAAVQVKDVTLTIK